MQITDNVDMVFYTIDAVQLAISVLYDAPDIFIQLLFMLWIDGGFTVLGTEYDVVIWRYDVMF